jgi:hypothetical protein
MWILRLSIFFILLATSLWAQEDESFLALTEGDRPDCRNRSFRASRKILAYEEQGKADSARMINAALQKYCGMTEPVLRYKLLDDLRSGRDSAEFISTGFVLDRLLDYRDRRRAIQRNYPSYNFLGDRFDYWADPNFDPWSRKIASGLDTTKSSIAPTIQSAYSDDWTGFTSRLRSRDENSPFAVEALNRLRSAHDGIRVTGMLFTGMWIPTGNLARVNEHFYSGFKFGGGAGRFDVNFRVGIVFPNGPYDYDVLYSDTLVHADVFAGPAMAIEPSVDLYRTLNWKLGLVGSIGSSFAATYSKESQGRGTTPDVSSKDLGLGLRVRRLWGTGGVTHAEVHYNFQDFGNDGGSSLSGNSISVLLGIGVEGSLTWWRARRIW